MIFIYLQVEAKMESHYIKELGIIDHTIQQRITDWVRADLEPLQPSRLYDQENKELLVDSATRSSQYKAMVNKELFDLVALMVEKLNEKDDYNNYLLVRNDVTFIKYQEGDFFKEHEDYLSLTSNV